MDPDTTQTQNIVWNKVLKGIVELTVTAIDPDVEVGDPAVTVVTTEDLDILDGLNFGSIPRASPGFCL
jgi:hypothetical protein